MIDGFVNQKNLQKSSNALSEPSLSARNEASNRKEVSSSQTKQFSKQLEEQTNSQAKNQKQPIDKDQKSVNSNPMSQLAESAIKTKNLQNQDRESGKKEIKDSEVVELLGGFDVVAQAVPSLALMSGRVELMDKQELVDLVSGDNVVGKALSSDSLPAVLQTQAPIEEHLKELGFKRQQIAKLFEAGFDLATPADMQSVLDELGVNPAKAVAELTQLKNTISQQGLTPYFEKMSALSMEDSTSSSRAHKSEDLLTNMQMQAPAKSTGQVLEPTAEKKQADTAEKKSSSKIVASSQSEQNPNFVVSESRDRSDDSQIISSASQSFFEPNSKEEINESTGFTNSEYGELRVVNETQDRPNSSAETNSRVNVSIPDQGDLVSSSGSNSHENPLILNGLVLQDQLNKGSSNLLIQKNANQNIPELDSMSLHFAPQNIILAQDPSQKVISKNSLDLFESENIEPSEIGALSEELATLGQKNNTSGPEVIDAVKAKSNFSDLARLQFELQTTNEKSNQENDFISDSSISLDQNSENIDKFNVQDRQTSKDAPNFIDFLRAETPATLTDSQGQESTPAPIENQQLSARIDQVINERMNVLAQQGGGDVRLDLSDEKNGKLEVQLNVSGKEVAVQFAAENEKVREFLRSELPNLKQHLQERDLQLTNAHVQQQFSQDRQAWSGQNFSDRQSNMKEIKSVQSSSSRARHHLDPIGFFKIPTLGPNSQSISVLV